MSLDQQPPSNAHRLQATWRSEISRAWREIRVRATRRWSPHTESALKQSGLKQLQSTFRELQRSTNPIIIGPWLSELGYELLYWIPFLNWAADEYGLQRERVIALSRGGAPWYNELASRYVDVFEDVTTLDYKAHIEVRSKELEHQKQYRTTDFEIELLNRVKQKLTISNAHVVHPSVMNRLLRAYWYERAPVGLRATEP